MSNVSFYGGAAGEIAICNMALRHLGAAEVLSLAQNTREADLCLRAYPHARQTLLGMHHWAFATRYLYLAPVAEAVTPATKVLVQASPATGLAHKYRVPVDCIAVQRLVPECFFAVGEGGYVYTNAAPAQAAVTVCITDATLYPPLFIDALAYRLATSLAVALVNSVRLEAIMAERFSAAFEAARLADAVQGGHAPQAAEQDPWLQVR